ncbi:MAG: DoxX family protein [Ahrensia sp.]|nr:DoxX family protein [Ahrensia sp.]
MTKIITGLTSLHHSIFGAIERATTGWFTGFSARFTFASVLLFYYLNSGWNKLGEGVFGFLNPSIGAYASILPSVMEEYGFDPDAVPFFPWDIIVLLGTWTELLLPILIVIGLFSRLAALGMIGFVIVQTYVDVNFHGLEGKFVGSMFDRLPDAVVWDQRLLWCFVLLIIVVNGPGKLSIDHLLAKRK